MRTGFWKWEGGRQKTGYFKKLLVESLWPLPFDVYLLRFPAGSWIPPHVDQVQGGRHYRLNMILKKAERGGDFLCKDPLFERPRVKLFRSDISEHEVTPVTSGCRYVLSLGWVLKGDGK